MSNLSNLQSAEKIADHFASISNEYPPLDIESLPDRVKLNLEIKTKPPVIEEYECYEKIKAAKKPKSTIPGDLPSEIIKEFSTELANPVHKLLNRIVKSQVGLSHGKWSTYHPLAKYHCQRVKMTCVQFLSQLSLAKC